MSGAAACERKRRYKSKRAARTKISQAGVPGLKIYKCNYCKKYHLTSMPKDLWPE